MADSIDRAFTLTINGETVANVVDNGEPRIHAQTGSDAAVLELRDGRLECGDWYLGRFQIEDRSLLPKCIYWFKKGEMSPDMIQPTFAEPSGDSFNLRVGGNHLKVMDGRIWADLIEDGDAVQLDLQ